MLRVRADGHVHATVSGDEMVSDSFPIEIVDDIVLKVIYKCGFALRELGTTIEMGSERFCFCDCLGVRGLGNSARGT